MTSSMNSAEFTVGDLFQMPGRNPVQDGTCSAEVCIRIASFMAAMARLSYYIKSQSINNKQ